MHEILYGFDIYLANFKTIRKIAQIFVAFSEKLNFKVKTRGAFFSNIAPFSQYLNLKIKDNSISASTFHHRVAHSMMKCGALSL